MTLRWISCSSGCAGTGFALSGRRLPGSARPLLLTFSTSLTVHEGGAMKRFDGQVAVVTGAGSGIGRASAMRLAAEGAHVVINDIAEDAAGQTRSEVAAAGGSAEVAAGDVLDEGYLDALFDEVVARCGQVDIVHNNVGFGRRSALVDVTDEHWARGIDGN